MPSEHELMEAYRTEYAKGRQDERYGDPEWWPKVARPYFMSVIKALKDHDVQGPVVDCGAGWGGLLALMRENGFDASGVELSDDQVAYARSRGLPMEQGDLTALKARDGTISAITLMTVFEHLTNHARLLADARRLLRDRGLLVTLHPTSACYRIAAQVLRLGNRQKELPDLDGSFAAPWHTILPSIEATIDLVSRAGFALRAVYPAPQGRRGGLVGMVQLGLEWTNKIGWSVFGRRWPLVTTHVFVFQKTD
jgi:SAM-dependent methyltransferase